MCLWVHAEVRTAVGSWAWLSSLLRQSPFSCGVNTRPAGPGAWGSSPLYLPFAVKNTRITVCCTGFSFSGGLQEWNLDCHTSVTCSFTC